MRQVRFEPDGARLTSEQVEQNFADLHPPLSDTQAVKESSRCLYCYEAPCVNACPTAIDIPGFIRRIHSGNLGGAAETILEANIMGGTCARACPTEVLCEQACVVNHREGSPVAIGLLQRHAVDALLDAGGPHPFARVPDSGRHLGVVGAGPAGLAFAHRAARLGHRVTVYEARPKAGGLNEYGLAAYKMVDDFAQRELRFILDVGGIDIVHGTALGPDLTIEELRSRHDAIFIGAGLSRPAALDIDGSGLAGVLPALEFIDALRQAIDKSAIELGDDVVVIGGGNTAIDAAMQARCLGVRRVRLAYRRGPEQMSATEWERDLAEVNGVDVRYWSTPVAIEGDSKVERVRFERTRLEGGKLVGTGEIETVPACLVLVAIGQAMNGAVKGIQLAGGKIRVGDDYQTSLPGVFAGGDCIDRGEDLTVQAIEHGKRAAEAADAWLAGRAKEQAHG
ncbi:MAG: NAD(P)-dependent oxidoreductase [Sphingosinicella sp.]